MDIVLWGLAGGIAGWIGYSYLGFNEERGMMVSAIIGAIGGVVGGKMISPMFGAVAAVPGEFSMAAMFVAVGVAAAFLFAGNLIHNRFGI